MIWANSLLGFTPGDAGVALSKDGEFSAVIRQSYTSPPEVATGPPGKWKAITRLNSRSATAHRQGHQRSWASDQPRCAGDADRAADRGTGRAAIRSSSRCMAVPPTRITRYSPRADSYDAVLAHQGYFVFKPNPRGSYGQGEAFARANVKDFGYGDLRDMLSGIDAVQSTAPIDPARIGICGWSYGGYMTMWALTQTDRFKAAVAGAGLSDWLSYYGTNNIDTWMIPYFGASVYDDPKVYERSSPLTFIKKVHTPTLIVGGDRDAEVPIRQSYEYWNALRRLGVKTEFVVYPDEGHDFFRHADQIDVMTRVLDWFNTYLKR